MAAILRDEEKYYYQIVSLNCMGIENNQIEINQCMGPFETFQVCCDKAKENH